VERFSFKFAQSCSFRPSLGPTLFHRRRSTAVFDFARVLSLPVRAPVVFLARSDFRAGQSRLELVPATRIPTAYFSVRSYRFPRRGQVLVA
jgi:hypothetical protein